jgi:hypothetical protein
MVCNNFNKKWIKQIKSNIVIDPNDNSFISQHILKKNKKIRTKIWNSNKDSMITYEKNPDFNYKLEAEKIFDDFKKQFIKASTEQKESKTKSLITQLDKNSINLNTVIRTQKYY